MGKLSERRPASALTLCQCAGCGSSPVVGPIVGAWGRAEMGETQPVLSRHLQLREMASAWFMEPQSVCTGRGCRWRPSNPILSFFKRDSLYPIIELGDGAENGSHVCLVPIGLRDNCLYF